MKTKLLLGSISAVVILILVSFTNVVGIQSSTSDSGNDSPLFTIRTQKRINQTSKTVLISDYLGKGLHAIQFPQRDNRTALFLKAIEIIEKMEYKEFNRFQNLILSHVSKDKNIKNIDIITLLTLTRHRSIPKMLEINQFNMNGNKTKYPTYSDSCQIFNCITIGNWFGCLLLLFVSSASIVGHVLLVMIYAIIENISNILYTINNF